MPQMSPMSWELLFMYFMTMYIMINMIIYWQNDKKINTMKNPLMTNNYKWTW